MVKAAKRNEYTPQEKKNYAFKRIVNKANSAYGQFQIDMKQVVSMAHLGGLDDQERSNLALMMADRFSSIIKKLAPIAKKNDKKTVAVPEGKKPQGKAKPKTKA